MANIDKAMKVLRLKADHHKYRMSSLNGIQSLYFYSVWKCWFRFGQLKFQIDTFSVPYTFLPLRIPFFHLVYTSMHSFIIIFFKWRVVFFFEKKKHNKLLLFSKILIQFREVVSATKLYSGLDFVIQKIVFVSNNDNRIHMKSKNYYIQGKYLNNDIFLMENSIIIYS